MSMHLEFEPHSYYMGFAIKKTPQIMYGGIKNYWEAFGEDDNSYRIIEREYTTLKGLKSQIKAYRNN